MKPPSFSFFLFFSSSIWTAGPRRPGLALLVALPLALLAGACSSAPAKDKAGTEPPSQRLLKSLEAEIGEARCSRDAECHSLAIGAKACGGPEGYRAWSSQAGDGRRLKSLAEQQAAARRAENSGKGLMSNCAVEADPGAQCQAGRCTLRPAATGGMSAV